MNKIPYIYSGFITREQAENFVRVNGGEVLERACTSRGEYDAEETQIVVIRYE